MNHMNAMYKITEQAEAISEMKAAAETFLDTQKTETANKAKATWAEQCCAATVSE